MASPLAAAEQAPVEVETMGAPAEPEALIKPKEQAWVAPALTSTKDAGEAAQQETTNADVNTGDPPTKKGPWCKCLSLKGTVLLGDSMPDEEFSFGNKEESSLGSIVRTQMCHVSVQITKQVMTAVPFLIMMSVLSALPPKASKAGDKGTTETTVILNAALTFGLNLCTLISVVIWGDHRRAGTLSLWIMITTSPLVAANALLKWNMFMQGKPDTTQTQFWIILCAVPFFIACAKMMTVPGWSPTWSTCFCVCGSLPKAVGTICCYYVFSSVGSLMLTNWVYYDNLVFSKNGSLAMAIIRPLAFFMVKKLVYSSFSMLSWMRHPMHTKCSTVAVSSILGYATAISFTKTRNWSGLISFILVGWSAHGSRMWTFMGAPGSNQCFLLKWYKQFMVFGKPIVNDSGKMKLKELRGFENLAQSWGTTFGLCLFTVFYLIANFGFGEDSMPRRFFFPTDLSIIFLVIALVNEHIMDVQTQIITIHATKCDYASLFSNELRSPLTCGVLFISTMVGLSMSTAWAWELRVLVVVGRG